MPDSPDYTKIWSQVFTLNLLREDIALLTYRSANVSDKGDLSRFALRASIWQNTHGRWKMRFHQGTPTSEFDKRDTT